MAGILELTTLQTYFVVKKYVSIVSVKILPKSFYDLRYCSNETFLTDGKYSSALLAIGEVNYKQRAIEIFDIRPSYYAKSNY